MAERSVLRCVAAIWSTDSSPVVRFVIDQDEAMLSPDEARQAAAMLTTAAEKAEALSATVLASDADRMLLMAYPAGRA